MKKRFLPAVIIIIWLLILAFLVIPSEINTAWKAVITLISFIIVFLLVSFIMAKFGMAAKNLKYTRIGRR